MSPSSTDDEEDFMSDAFLAKMTAAQPATSATSSSSRSRPLTYQEKRRAKLAAIEAKNRSNALKPYREREAEARKEAMGTTLFEKAEMDRKVAAAAAAAATVENGDGSTKAGGGLSIAMGMMEKMGYKVGEGLGRKRNDIHSTPPIGQSDAGRTSEAIKEQDPDNLPNPSGKEDPDDDRDGNASARGGLGSSKRRRLEDLSPVPGFSDTHRFEPIAVSLWSGRKGIGSKPTIPPPPPSAPSSALFPPNIDSTEYRSRAKQEYDEKRAESQLRSARATVMELDEREDRGFSILHLNPLHIPSFPEPLLQELTHPTSFPTSTSPPSTSFSSRPDVNRPPSRSPSPIEDPSDHPSIGGLGSIVLPQAEILRRQMALDALQPLTEPSTDDTLSSLNPSSSSLLAPSKPNHDDDVKPSNTEIEPASSSGEEEEDWRLLALEATKFIRLPASDRLRLTLTYLREEFGYCFWCGVGYGDRRALEEEGGCPGEKEEDH